jgi:NhaP-type Na+/H+ or K+/H+ antiporter
VVIVVAEGSSEEGRRFFRDYFTFKEELFFFILLPPIILDAGYNMARKSNFFYNFGAILLFAGLLTQRCQGGRPAPLD